MIKRPDTNAQRIKRHKRVRAKISGTPERPRLNVFRSEKNIYAQIIDDVAGNTLVAASSLDKEIEGNGGNKAAARAVGKLVAERAKAKGIDVVVFDRGGYLYHGRVAELAEGAREGGLAIYLGIVAIAPLIVGKALDNYSLAIGGTSVIIVVGVALETVQALESQMLMRQYKGFLE